MVCRFVRARRDARAVVRDDKFGADTSVALEQRMVNLRSVRIDEVNFDKIAADETQKLKMELTQVDDRRAIA
jgi:hypothetical protein